MNIEIEDDRVSIFVTIMYSTDTKIWTRLE